MNVMEIDSVSYSVRGRNILSDVYIKIQSGRVTTLIGRNGEGKSSLFKVIYGVTKAESRSIRLNQTHLPADPYNMPGLINCLPQSSFLPKGLKVNAAFDFFSLQPQAFLEIFPELKFNEQQKIGQLSGGERRLLEAFLIIRTNTLFTILDEPFAFLTPIYIERLKEMISHEKVRKGFLVTDHFVHDICAISDDLYYINAGHVCLTNLEKLTGLGYLM